jgi:class 3 adenylate cyclase
MSDLPTGTVTFLFTDIEGSTRLLETLGDRYAEALLVHRRLLQTLIERHGGGVLGTEGDAVFAWFPRARDALAAAIEGQRVLAAHAWPENARLRVRMGVHTGEPVRADIGYVGIDLHRTARIAAAGHGGQILISDTTRALVQDDLPDGTSIRAVGEHRLKDLRRPEHLFQVDLADLPSQFPPLRTLDARPHNLPIQLTSFIGREEDIAKVRRALGTSRLLTLTGPGGSGKTRLAMQIAAEVLEGYKDGVWFVELGHLAEGAMVPQATASVLGIREPARAPTEALLESLQGQEVLVLFDNCEHVLDACADLATKLIHSAARVRIMATSREPLGVPGEVTYRVLPFAPPTPWQLPPLHELIKFPSVRLFVERAATTQPSFSLTDDNARAVAEICWRLDGLPLALELAAARVRVLAPDQIAARLNSRFRLLTGGSRTALPHHRTLQATLDWSHDLLAPTRERFFDGCPCSQAGSRWKRSKAYAPTRNWPRTTRWTVSRASSISPSSLWSRIRTRRGTACWKPCGNTVVTGSSRRTRQPTYAAATFTGTQHWPSALSPSCRARVRRCGSAGSKQSTTMSAALSSGV